jgi:heme/copper-type cytochrome/quinol oxidase subunit 2
VNGRGGVAYLLVRIFFPEKSAHNTEYYERIVLIHIFLMSSKSLFVILGSLVIVVAGYFFISGGTPKQSDENFAAAAPVVHEEQAPSVTPPPPVGMMETGEIPESASAPTPPGAGTAVKEFALKSWMDKIDGKMAAHFSLPEIVVKKGDKVRIKVTNTAGTHNFVIDEYGIDKETPLNQETVIEFTADKAGEFEYYCAKYNHRSLGQRGTLKVIE